MELRTGFRVKILAVLTSALIAMPAFANGQDRADFYRTAPKPLTTLVFIVHTVLEADEHGKEMPVLDGVTIRRGLVNTTRSKGGEDTRSDRFIAEAADPSGRPLSSQSASATTRPCPYRLPQAMPMIGSPDMFGKNIPRRR